MVPVKKQTLWRREKSEFSLQMDASGMLLDLQIARSMGPAVDDADEVIRA